MNMVEETHSICKALSLSTQSTPPLLLQEGEEAVQRNKKANEKTKEREERRQNDLSVLSLGWV